MAYSYEHLISCYYRDRDKVILYRKMRARIAVKQIALLSGVGAIGVFTLGAIEDRFILTQAICLFGGFFLLLLGYILTEIIFNSVKNIENKIYYEEA